MDHQIPEYLLTLNFLVRVVVPSSVVAGVWYAVRRSSLTAFQQSTTGLAISAAVLGWFGLAWWLGQANAFVIGADQIPRIQFAILTPIIAGLMLMLMTARGRGVVAAAPQPWLIGMQVYRALGFMFLLFWARGQMPGEFAIPAGVGDIIVGVSAPFVALANFRQSPGHERLTRMWNLFGIADLVVAVTTGFLTSPSPIQLLAFDRPNLLITEYPTVMVPAFLVPMSIILHGLSLWKLRSSEAVSSSAYCRSSSRQVRCAQAA